METELAHKALEELLLDIDILDELESKISNFNAFETLGIIHTEIRHSNVLSWLLSPNESHGMGDIILRTFVQRLFQQYKSELSGINTTLIHVALMDYSDFQIRREWRNIDVAIFSEKNRLVIIIENKIWAGESVHQLEKYHRSVEEEFQGYEKIFIFLTPDGIPPSDNSTWLSISYPFFMNIIENALNKRENISQSVRAFVSQYLEVLRRHIVGDTELAKICRDIYFKHQKALDLIFEYKPDVYSEISTYIEDCLKEYPQIIKDSSTKSVVRFLTVELDRVIEHTGKGWTSSNRILLYEFQNRNEKLVLKLFIGPGEVAVREKLFAIAKSNSSLFKGMLSTLTPQYSQIYVKEILPKNFIEKYEMEIIQEKIKKEISTLVNGDLKEIETMIVQLFVNGSDDLHGL